MLTLRDCLGLCDLTEEEVAVIAEYEHVPIIVALEEGNCLLCQDGGADRIAQMFTDVIERAETAGHAQHAIEVRRVYRRFVSTHPCSCP